MLDLALQRLAFYAGWLEKGVRPLFMLMLMLMLLSGVANAETTVTATVDRNQVSQGDVLTLEVSVSSSDSVSVQPPQLPTLDGFTLLNTSQAQQSQSTFDNGKFNVNHSQIYSYTLSPQTQGKQTIGSVRVKVDGKEFKTQPIEISVVAGVPQNQNNQVQNRRGRGRIINPNDSEDDPFAQMEDVFNQMLRNRPNAGIRSQPVNPDDAFFIQADVDKNSIYVGEQVTANWYLYTRAQITDIDTLNYPSLKGFWKEDLEIATRLNFVGEVINGIQYNKALLTSYALFPLSAGSSVIDPYRAKCVVLQGAGFGFGRTTEVTKSSREIQISVKPLPTEGRPESFTGGVGEYEVSSQIDRTTVPSGQPVSIKIHIEGRGHAKGIELPKIEWPKTLSFYDSKSDAKFFKNGQSYKDFELIVIPTQEGQLTIPSLEFGFFTPKTARYYTKQTPTFQLNVLKGTNMAIAASPLVTPQAETPTKESSPSLLRNYRLSPPHSLSSLGISKWLAILVLLSGLFGLWARWQLRSVSKRADLRTKLKLRVKRLYELAQSGNWRQLGVEGTNTLFMLIGEIAGLGAANLDSDRMLEKTPPTIRKELGPEIQKLLQEFQVLGFAPDAATESLRERKQLRQAVAQLDKVLSRAIQLTQSTEEK